MGKFCIVRTVNVCLRQFTNARNIVLILTKERPERTGPAERDGSVSDRREK